MTYPQLHDSARENSLLTSVFMVAKETGRNDACNVEPALNITEHGAFDMSLIPTKPGIYSAQATQSPTYDGISARDDFLRKEAERGSEMLLRAMIRELEGMGVLA